MQLEKVQLKVNSITQDTIARMVQTTQILSAEATEGAARVYAFSWVC